MKALRIVLTAAALSIAAVASSMAQSANYNGKIWLVQNTGTPGTVRFHTAGPPASRISLFASGDFKDILLQAFFRKANVSVGYTPLSPCPGGVTGACGTVTFVSVNTTGF